MNGVEQTVSENIEEQLNELLALKSIFSGTADSIDYAVKEDESVKVSGTVVINFPKFEKPISVMFDAENPAGEKLTISFLPPLLLEFEFPVDYPQNSPPNVTINSSWLSEIKQAEVKKRLSAVWNDFHGMPVLFSWIEALKDDVTKDFLADEMINFTSDQLNNLKDQLKLIVEHDETMIQNEFDNGWYQCEVCFDSKSGKESIRFMPCSHVFCVACVSQFYRQQLSENRLRHMQCLNEDCESSATQKQIQCVLTEQEYELYEKRLLEGTLDSMSDVVKCPRLLCQAPVIVDEPKTDEAYGLASCSLCRYSFCTLCRKAYHGIEPCALDAEARDKFLQEHENVDDARREQIYRQFGGKKKFMKYLETMKSDQWIKKNSKPCPRCQCQIEKVSGCNKVLCTKCGCNFCWFCAAVLNKLDPYRHFNDPDIGGCYERLFEGLEDAELLGIDDSDSSDEEIQ